MAGTVGRRTGTGASIDTAAEPALIDTAAEPARRPGGPGRCGARPRRHRSGRGVVVATLAVLVALLTTLTTLTPAAPPAAAQDEPSTLRVALTQDIDSLNPFVAVFLGSTQVGRLMYENLTVAGPDNSIAPGLAERWEPSADGLTWTFTIREAQWSDGVPITARDVAFTYNQLMSNPDAQGANGSAVSNFAAVTAVDDRTLTITTKAPQASILAPGIPVVPEHIWRDRVGAIDAPIDAGALPEVGSGPFVLTGYQEGQSVTLEANDRFWRGRPAVDRLQFVRYDNTDAAVQGLIAGDLDLVRDTTPAQFGALATNPTITRNEGRNRRYAELLLNWSNPSGETGQAYGDGHPALRDVRVRRALHHAIDTSVIVDRVKQGFAEPGTSIIPPVYPEWAFTPTADQLRGYDPARAQALLDEAGFPLGPDGVRVGPDGRPLTLRLLSATDAASNRQTADFLVGWFSAVGVGLTPEFVSSNQADDAQVAGNFDIAFSGWSVNPDPDGTLSQQTCRFNGTSLSDSGYCNPAYDALYTRQQAELDPAVRRATVQQMQSLLYDDVSQIVLSHDRLLEAYRSDRFTGFVTQPVDGGVITGQTGYWGYYGATPVAAAPGADGTGGANGVVVGVIVAAAVLLLGGVGFLLWRRRSTTAEDRE